VSKAELMILTSREITCLHIPVTVEGAARDPYRQT
jgi:hypothetical protein